MAGLPEPGDSDADAPAGARPAGDELPVTVLYSRRVKPGREADFESWAHGIVAASRQFPGHLSASVLDDPATANTTSCSASPTAGAWGPGWTLTSAGGGWPRWAS